MEKKDLAGFLARYDFMRLETKKSNVSQWASYGVAMVLVIAGGTGYRMAAARYERLATSVPLPKGTLSGVAMAIGEWRGRDIALSERVVKATDTDDHVNRVYQRSPYETVSLFVAYGVHLRDLMPHRPEVCYISSGWTLADSRKVEIPLPDGQTLPCRVHHFRRGGLESKSITVLNYYLVDGEYGADVSLLRSRARQLQAQGTYSAQVQVTTSSEELGDREDELVSSFAADSASLIRSVLTDAIQKATSQPN